MELGKFTYFGFVAEQEKQVMTVFLKKKTSFFFAFTFVPPLSLLHLQHPKINMLSVWKTNTALK